MEESEWLVSRFLFACNDTGFQEQSLHHNSSNAFPALQFASELFYAHKSTIGRKFAEKALRIHESRFPEITHHTVSGLLPEVPNVDHLELIAARLLHSVCGPYPETSTDYLSELIQTRLIPVIILLVFILNSAICCVLTRRHMRTPIYSILLSIAVAELFTGLLPLPMYLGRSFIGGTVWWERMV
ncbi:unnamed protein product, partial [Protopolystoma xenopodis]